MTSAPGQAPQPLTRERIIATVNTLREKKYGDGSWRMAVGQAVMVLGEEYASPALSRAKQWTHADRQQHRWCICRQVLDAMGTKVPELLELGAFVTEQPARAADVAARWDAWAREELFHYRILHDFKSAFRQAHPLDAHDRLNESNKQKLDEAKSVAVEIILSGASVPGLAVRVSAGKLRFDQRELRDAMQRDHEKRELESKPYAGPLPLPEVSPIEAAQRALQAREVRDALDHVATWCRERGSSFGAANQYLLGRMGYQTKLSRMKVAGSVGTTEEALRHAEPAVLSKLKAELRSIA